MKRIISKRDEAIEAVDNDAYTNHCKCPECGKLMTRGIEEEIKFCTNCGQKLHLRAFTKEEVDDAIFQHEMDEYED